MDTEDERQTELDCIVAIFPEIQLDSQNPFCATIDIPVHPTVPVKVNFPGSSDGGGAYLPTPPESVSGQAHDENVEIVADVESHNLSYLPSITLRITLPEGYPEEKPAKFELSTTPEWLSRTYLDELEQKADVMWEENGRTQVIYEYIDSLQQSAENAFGFADGKKTLEIPQDFMISLLDFDIKATQAAFEKETFDCGICLDPKKGTVCHRMIDCGHVFCTQCLQDFYNNAITEGDLISVKCLTPDCAKKREEERPSTKKHRKPKTQLSPSELLQIPLEHEMVTRYVKLKHKAELESDKNTVYCPRKWCQGAAKSKKHRKPDGLDDDDSSDEESDTEAKADKKFSAGDDLLVICEDCDFAFCSRCFSSWHGEFKLCAPKKATGELTDEDKASLEYMRMHTTPCPTCASPAQKTHGCNHMICYRCHSHFCYLCSAWLLPSNPYEHYNTETTGCYMRLWELEGGDGDDVGIGFGGGARGIEIPDEEEEEDGDEMPDLHALAAVIAELRLAPDNVLDIPEIVEPPDVPRQEMQREGPLVLRINQMPAPPVLAPAAPDPPLVIGNRRRGGAQRQVQRNGPAPVAARRPARGNAQRPGGRGGAAIDDANVREAADRAWIQMFVQMAQNDEEDLLEDDEEDAAAWEIQHRQ